VRFDIIEGGERLMLFENVLAAIFNSLGLDESDYKLVNADVLPVDQLGVSILKTRINEAEKYKKIIFYGFDPYEALLGKETYNPRLLVSPAVYYLQLPINIADVERIDSSKGIDKQKDVYESISNYMFTGTQLSRMDSVFSHKYGNLFGPEKLLYGAYLSGHYDYKKIKSSMTQIDSILNNYYSDIKNSPEYISYTFNRKYNDFPNSIKKCKSKLRGSFLVIDDQAHIGWMQAIAHSFNCTDIKEYATEGKVLKINKWSKKDYSLEFTFISNDKFYDKNIKYEETFITELTDKISKEYLNPFDVVIMDYRLRAFSDENLENPSSINLIRHMRNQSRAIPIVIFTASNKAKTLANIKKNGADCFFSKKINLDFFSNENSAEPYKKYYSEFEALLEENYAKKYLKILCEIIDSHKPKISDKSQIYDFNYYLELAIDLLRADVDGTFSKEALLNLSVARELFSGGGSLNQSSFDNYFIIKNLRNHIIHGKFSAGSLNPKYFLEDAKVVFYSFIRLFYDVDCDLLLKLSNSMFSNIINNPQNMQNSICKKIVSLFNFHNGKSFKFSHLNSYTKKQNITFSTVGAMLDYSQNPNITERESVYLWSLRQIVNKNKIFNNADIHVINNFCGGFINK